MSCPEETLLSTVVADLILKLKPPLCGVNTDDYTNLASSLLWSVDLDWSDQAAGLRSSAITHPNLYTLESAQDNITHLRIVGKQVTDVDRGMLQFSNLEELTVTGNIISKVSLACLPPGVKVLELCYNRLTDLPYTVESTLSGLQHLGMAFNGLSHLQLTHSHWPMLMSLDLSHNSLFDLEGSVGVLQKLKSLRSLMLTGNPFTLVQQYKKYTVDVLRQLICLDGSDITPSMIEEAEGAVAVCGNQPEFITTCGLDFCASKLDGLSQFSPEVEGGEQEGTTTVRHVLMIGYEFLQHGQYTSLINMENSEKDVLKLVPCAERGSSIFFRPVVYKANMSLTDMKHSFSVTGLNALVNLLVEGIKVCAYLGKIVYGKIDQLKDESPSLARKQLTSANKSGRTSAQSGASNVKKPVATNVKGGKVKVTSQDQDKLPDDGWRIVDSAVYKLGCGTLDVAALLEDKRSLIVACDLSLSVEDQCSLRQSGMFHAEETDKMETDHGQSSSVNKTNFVVEMCVKQL